MQAFQHLFLFFHSEPRSVTVDRRCYNDVWWTCRIFYASQKVDELLSDGREFLLSTPRPTYLDFHLASMLAIVITTPEYSGGVLTSRCWHCLMYLESVIFALNSAKYKYDHFRQKLRSVNYGASKEVIEEAERLKKTRWSHFREKLHLRKDKVILLQRERKCKTMYFWEKSANDIQIKENLIIMEIGSEWIIAGLANLWWSALQSIDMWSLGETDSSQISTFSKYIKSQLVITPSVSVEKQYLHVMWMDPVHGGMELGSIRKSVNEDAGQRAPIIPPLPSLPDTPIRNHLPNLVINLEKRLNHN